MKRVEIPVFNGDKRKYEEWKSAFVACVDASPAAPDYKMLELKQYLGGEALQFVAKLGYTAAAYAAAKQRLEKKYGGARRQVAGYLEDLAQFADLRSSKARELEKFADLLEVAVINLQDAGHTAELRAGTFYMSLLKKLSEPMIAQFQRWLFEHRKAESVLTLLEWVTQEAECQVTALETVHGLAAARISSPPPRSNSTDTRQACRGGHIGRF